jgi:hypothetical protein
MYCPAFGFYLPVDFHRVRDVDTIEVHASGAFVWAIRLIGTWGPELHRGDHQELARRGKRWVGDYLATCQELALYLPLPEGQNLLKALTFDRVPGHLLLARSVGIDVPTLNELVVREGFASTTKGGPLGK